MSFVTRSPRTHGQHAFRSLCSCATAIIGPYSRAYGSLSCSCKRAEYPILTSDLTVTCSLHSASIAVPAGLHGPILHSLEKQMTRFDAIAETRFITFVIAIGVLMLFFGPHIVWKFMGQKRATELVKRWEAEDARLHAPGSFVPVWTVNLAGYLSYDTVRWSILLRPVPFEPALLFSVSRLQLQTHPLHHTFIQLRINRRYVVLILPIISALMIAVDQCPCRHYFP